MHDDLNVTEELLEVIPMHGHTTSLDIFEKLVTVLQQYNLPFNKIVGLATDGAPAMIGIDNGVGKRLFSEILQSNPNASFIHVHCIIHQEVLCGKALKFDNVLKIVTKVVNFIRARGLNHRQFTEFLKEIQSEFEGIPYYTHVRWLSCHAVLKRFFELLEEIASFLEVKEKVFAELHSEIWVQDLAFCTDITGHLAELNLRLQGKEKVITYLHDEIRKFKCKLLLWTTQIKNENLCNFSSCTKLSTANSQLQFKKYAKKLEVLSKEFSKRFRDFDSMQEKFNIFTAPFGYDVERAPESLQLELIELQCDSFLKRKYDEITDIAQFYQLLPNDRFPNFKRFVAEILALFGSTYTCEQFFSIMNLNKSAVRTRLTDDNLSSTLKVAVSNKFKPNIEKLSSEMRCQKSSSSKT